MHRNQQLDPLHYALNLIGEESSEVAKEVSKIMRFGLFDKRPSTNETNLEVLQNELTDLIAAVHIVNQELVLAGLPPLRLDDSERQSVKFRKVEFYAERSMERGTLSERLAFMSPRQE